MKATIKDGASFRPFTLSIKVETLSELHTLYAMANSCGTVEGSRLVENTTCSVPTNAQIVRATSCTLFEALRQEVLRCASNQP